MVRNASSVLASALTVLAADALGAQHKGCTPPPIEFVKVWNDGPKSFGELEGRVVILYFGTTGSGPCNAAVAHLNELHEKFAERGLLVIGVSDEQEDTIEKRWVDGFANFVVKGGAKYPIAKIKASDTGKYRITSYPSVYSITPYGIVHSVPDDRMPSEATIEELLEDVSFGPKLPEDSRYDPLRKMWSKRDYRRLDAYLNKMLKADKLDAEMRDVFAGQQQGLQKKAAKQVARVYSVGEGPHYLLARATLEFVQKEWAGFTAAVAATDELKRFAKDSRIKKEIAASEALAKLESKYDPSRISQRRKLIDALGKFAEKYRGTYAGEQAKKRLGR
jgi:thiol-disulfide isomerase/thioredoxin